MDLTSIQYSMEIVSGSVEGDTTQAQPNPEDLKQFNQQLQIPTENAEDQSLSPLSGASSEATLGDKVLSGIQTMKEGYDHQVDQITKTIDSTDPMDVQDMMKLQIDLAKLTLQGEIINKTVSKSTQNIDTLLKSQ